MDQLPLLGDPGSLMRLLLTPAVITWAVLGTIVSVIGLIAFTRGRRSHKRVLMIGGVALMLYPYVVYDWVAMVLLGAVICFGMIVFQDAL